MVKIPVKYIDTSQYTVNVAYDDCFTSLADFTDAFEIIHFSNRNIDQYYDGVKFNKDIAKKLKSGEMFLFDKYEHGNSAFTLHKEGMNCRFDTSPMAGIIQLNYVDGMSYDERQIYARGCLSDYTDIFNGEVYHASILNSLGYEVDSVGGLVGTDSVNQYIKEVLPNTDSSNITINYI